VNGIVLGAVAYDSELASRIRALIGERPDLAEKTMFGGLAFLVGGNMAIAASGQGGLLVRVDPAGCDELVATTGARVMEMRGKPMVGWLRVQAADVESDDELGSWVERGVSYAGSLPPKG
jgi:TfoX/Sxy family transcriptional regulator of competence genes